MPQAAAQTKAAPAPGSVERYLPEIVCCLLLIGAFVAGSHLSRHFLNARYLLQATSAYMETGIMALAMTLIIVAGKIDLSVASTLSLSACATALLNTAAGVPLPVALLCGLLLGGLLGLLNGLMIVKLRLPSLTVTLGTLALYRGVAQILLGDHSIARFPDWFAGIDYRYVGPLPLPLVLFLCLAVGAAVLLHRTAFGRTLYAQGAGHTASRYSGVAVGRNTVVLFTLSGLMAAIAGLIMTSRLGVARFDLGLGLELNVITAVVLGGADIFGGRGTIFGTVTALFLLGIVRDAMGVANITAQEQLIVMGVLLLLSVGLANLLRGRAGGALRGR
ncbi:MAG: ABC transporter permease [Armatimonadetes bacterium]|nr:ABC transporter permease [Armatimonadota bacterium]MDE2205258.1 ABC transporter permease [Armatimonadota bacterium]